MKLIRDSPKQESNQIAVVNGNYSNNLINPRFIPFTLLNKVSQMEQVKYYWFSNLGEAYLVDQSHKSDEFHKTKW